MVSVVYYGVGGWVKAFTWLQAVRILQLLGPPSWAHTWKVTVMVISARGVAGMGNGTRISRIDTFVLSCLQGGGSRKWYVGNIGGGPFVNLQNIPIFFYIKL